MASLSPEQRRVLADFKRAIRNTRATRKPAKALVEAGSVESNLQNLPYGDRDSTGSLQQRASSGYRNAQNPYLAAVDFLKQAIPLKGKYGTAGQLAQAVQRSAFPGRYDQRSAQANALLRGGSYGSAASVPATPTAATGAPSDSRQQIALSLLGMGGPAGGYGGGGDPLTAALLQATQQQTGPTRAPQAASYGGVSAGQLLGHPLDRPGARTGKAILSFASQVAGVYGHPVRLGTGTAHDRLTVNGNVSAHWAGNALDLPATGKQNLALGRAALIAAGMPPAKARKANGGIYNVGNHQIIFQTNEGGNHFNHVHVGLR